MVIGREQARRLAVKQALSLQDTVACVVRQGITHERARIMRKVLQSRFIYYRLQYNLI